MSDTKPSDEHIQLITRLTKKLVDAYDVIEALKNENSNLRRDYHEACRIIQSSKSDLQNGYQPVGESTNPPGQE